MNIIRMLRNKIATKVFRLLKPAFQRYYNILDDERPLINIISHDYGHRESMEKKSSIDRLGKPLPWYTYPAIEYLSQINFSSLNVFEYSSGNGSHWWADRCKSIRSIEDDADWFAKVKEEIRSNHDLQLHKEEGSYIQSLRGMASIANILIIDGSHRAKCVDFIIENRLQLDKLKMIVFDNSDWYPDSCKKLQKDLDLIQIDFFGLGPINTYSWCTSLFIQRSWTPPYNNRQPNYAVGGLQTNAEA